MSQKILLFRHVDIASCLRLVSHPLNLVCAGFAAVFVHRAETGVEHL